MRVTVSAVLLLGLVVGESAAQWASPQSVRLNDPTLASQYLSVPTPELQGHSAYTIEAWAVSGGTTTLQWTTAGIRPGVYFAVMQVDGAIQEKLCVVVVR